MTETAVLEAKPKAAKSRLRRWIRKAVSLVVAGVVCGWLYGWAVPRFYPDDVPVGFRHGFIHGALMPMALPNLLLGGNASIYASNNNGRFYKIGYIAGINVCGLLFFGLAFWQPKKKSAAVVDG